MSESILWRDWDASALAAAAAANTPIVLSLVTAWSDACRVMDRTTFADSTIAAMLSSRFVAVRVDADRRPDINERYNLGGWPTTAFLTPDGDVLTGATHVDVSHLKTMAEQVLEAWRQRSAEIRASAAEQRSARAATRENDGGPDRSALARLRALLLQGVDRPPYVPALRLALSLVSEDRADTDTELQSFVETTLERLDRLWDARSGGFFRAADAVDWSRPSSEKTLEDNAALLHLFVDAAAIDGREAYRARAGELVQWVKGTLAHDDTGFFNAESGAFIDKSQYVDRNARMVGAFLRASVLFSDPWLRDAALKIFESSVLAGYAPGEGVAHAPGVRGLLGDQLEVAEAAIWAHAITEQLPYSMLAAELVEFSIRTMWDDRQSAFRDRVVPDDPLFPLGLNCEAACLLDRLATLTGRASYRDRALTILGALAGEYARQDLFGAPYGLAIQEVTERRPPPGLSLGRVDWGL